MYASLDLRGNPLLFHKDLRRIRYSRREAGKHADEYRQQHHVHVVRMSSLANTTLREEPGQEYRN